MQSMFFKVLAVLYPVLTLYCIMVTANHYPLDAVFGILALCIAAKVAVFLPQVMREHSCVTLSPCKVIATHHNWLEKQENEEEDMSSDWCLLWRACNESPLSQYTLTC